MNLLKIEYIDRTVTRTINKAFNLYQFKQSESAKGNGFVRAWIV
jgi:hypothetical protein